MTARQRVIIDFPVDEATGGHRAMAAVAEEMKAYAVVVLIKEHEIRLEDYAEVISTHVHQSNESYACEECVRAAELVFDD